MKTPKLRFRDLRVGESFEFDRSGLPLASAMMHGPWRKTAARKYVLAADATFECRVGSVNAHVVREG